MSARHGLVCAKPLAFAMPEQDYADGISRFAGAERVCAELNRRSYYCDYRPGTGLRASPHFYTSDEEVERFMDEVERLRQIAKL